MKLHWGGSGVAIQQPSPQMTPDEALAKDLREACERVCTLKDQLLAQGWRVGMYFGLEHGKSTVLLDIDRRVKLTVRDG